MIFAYQVCDWDQHFENNKSRERDQCHYVCIPNKQDGMGLNRVLAHPNGAAIFGIFHLIVEACSRQKRPRAGWLTDTGRAPDGHLTGTAWAPADLAFRWRRKEEEITEALEVLSSPNIGWIKKLQIGIEAGARQVPVECPPGAPQVPAECLGREGKGTEGNRSTPPRAREANGEMLSLEQVRAAVMTVGIPDEFSAMVYETWTQRCGKDGAGVPVEIVGYVRSRWNKEQSEWRAGSHRAQQKGANGSHRSNSKQSPNRNSGTLNDPAKYSAENLRKLPNYRTA